MVPVRFVDRADADESGKPATAPNLDKRNSVELAGEGLLDDEEEATCTCRIRDGIPEAPVIGAELLNLCYLCMIPP